MDIACNCYWRIYPALATTTVHRSSKNASTRVSVLLPFQPPPPTTPSIQPYFSVAGVQIRIGIDRIRNLRLPEPNPPLKKNLCCIRYHNRYNRTYPYSLFL